MIRFIIYSIALSLFWACTPQNDAQQIIDKAIEKAGGKKYQNSTIQFVFRDHSYQVKRNASHFSMIRKKITDSITVVDEINAASFQRKVNGKEVTVPDSMVFKYRESINSVIYFALLPYRLNDPAVNKEYLSETEIKGEKYHAIKVSFSKEDGGVDFQDVYVYWFHTKTFNMDYLAYSFEVNEGGYRFREAYNRRTVGGIQFADYVNYKPIEQPTSVEDLSRLFLEEKLKVLSKIELKDISVSSPAS